MIALLRRRVLVKRRIPEWMTLIPFPGIDKFPSDLIPDFLPSAPFSLFFFLSFLHIRRLFERLTSPGIPFLQGSIKSHPNSQSGTFDLSKLCYAPSATTSCLPFLASLVALWRSYLYHSLVSYAGVLLPSQSYVRQKQSNVFFLLGTTRYGTRHVLILLRRLSLPQSGEYRFWNYQFCPIL